MSGAYGRTAPRGREAAWRRWAPLGAVALWIGSGAFSPGDAAAQEVAYPHGETRQPLDCTLCHTQRGWSPAREPLEFDHDAATGFPRTGRHAELTCETCHLGLKFAEPRISAANCADCHVDVHLGNLSSECTACHTTTSFDDVNGVALHARTALPLTGNHLQITCASCHVDDTGGAFTTLDPECYACHADDYAAATLDHAQNGFSTDCEACHNTLAFGAGIAFDHVTVSGGFRLHGVHARIPCASCHIVPGFEPLYPGVGDQDCFACHQDDYEGATPDHVGSGFPTTCNACHTVERWDDATFTQHDALFPIYSGAHAGRWDDCATCHEQPGDFGVFTCFNCHQHDQARMDDKHKEEPGYVYDSAACYDCHPRGRKE